MWLGEGSRGQHPPKRGPCYHSLCKMQKARPGPRTLFPRESTQRQNAMCRHTNARWKQSRPAVCLSPAFDRGRFHTHSPPLLAAPGSSCKAPHLLSMAWPQRSGRQPLAPARWQKLSNPDSSELPAPGPPPPPRASPSGGYNARSVCEKGLWRPKTNCPPGSGQWWPFSPPAPRRPREDGIS